MTKNRFIHGDNPKNDSGLHGRRSEKRVAKKFGLKETVASGALFQKGDATLDTGNIDFRLECKATKNKSMKLDYGWLKKIAEEAYSTSRVPALTISFVDVKGDAVPNGDWVCIPDYLFKEFINGLHKKDKD